LAFFVQTSFLCLEFGFEQIFVCKICAKNVDEIDQRFFVGHEAFGDKFGGDASKKV